MTSLEAAALARQERLALLDAPEMVATIAPEHDHTRPALLSDQLLRVSTPVGTGWLPFSASHPLDSPLPGITEAYVPQHGIKRNALEYFVKALLARSSAGGFDSSKTLIVAPQFPAPIDPVDYYMLRWGYAGWMGGEPAVRPSPPIGSFEAKDALAERLVAILPDLRAIRYRGNSKGGQMDDRYLAFSPVLKRLEQEHSIQITGVVSNPGTLLYFDNLRPRLKFPLRPGVTPLQQDVEWYPVPHDSPANRWPYGMFDPPPYITQYLRKYSLEEAKADYARRASLCVGELDNDPNGSQLPTGPGPDEQGPTRYARVVGKWLALRREGHNAHLIIARNCGHDAEQTFALAEELRAVQARLPLGGLALDQGG